jgi:tetratricopeptide (TPR) repeat protein
LDAGSDHLSVVAAMHAFRLADSQFGGAELYPAVVAYLQSQIGPRLVGGIDETSTPAAFNAGASMLEMAGWMAHDRGDDQTAQDHFNRALAFTAVGDDEHLRAQVLGSMSHLAAHLGRPHETIRLARQGQDVLGQAPPHSPLAARLLALEARGEAGLGDTGRPLELLARAESELDKRGSLGQPLSPWLSQYDRASLASDAGRCLLRLGDLSEARREAELIIELRPARRARSRGLGQLALATVLVAQGALDEASVVAEQTLDSDLPVQSAPITRGLRTLHEKLAPHRTNIKAAKIHVRLTVTLQQRDSLHGQGRPVRIRPDA